jgi:23S rRNA (cytidine1920-2'-O)/16S rRNA (cytidine1409-2'-O)-methyltransferase
VKKRLDVLLVERGLAESRARAQALIMAGEVSVSGRVLDKAGTQVDSAVEIAVREPLPFVSRGGFKLAGALDDFGVSPAGYVCADIGASTGGVNARHLAALPEPVDLVVIDVSFISLELILPAAKPFLKPDGQIIALIKPQFEAGREEVGKGGIVRDPQIHAAVKEKIVRFAESIGLTVLGVIPSPITGTEGNIEFLIHLRN